MSMDASSLVGTLSGLIAIFSFVTGVTSIKDLHRPSPPSTSRARSATRRAQDATRSRSTEGVQHSRSLRVLAISAPIFFVALIITLMQGLGGSDTGGAQFLLLIVGAALLLLYATALHSSMSWPRFFAICVAGLGVIGFLMGSASRGEEAESTLAGLLIGAVIGLFGLVVPIRKGS
jgi:hypothetical protein